MKSKTTTTNKKVIVSQRAIVARLRRALAKDGEHIRRSRSQRMEIDCGEWYTISDQNCVCRTHIDVEELAVALGVLAPWEAIEDQAKPLSEEISGTV